MQPALQTLYAFLTMGVSAYRTRRCKLPIVFVDATPRTDIREVPYIDRLTQA